MVPPTTHLPFALVKLKHMVDLLHFKPHAVTATHGPGSVMIRLALLHSGLRALSHHPFGLGPRGAERYYTYWLHHPSPYNTYGVVDAHNMWLENAIDFGWIGLLLYTVFYAWLLQGLYKIGQHHDPYVRYVAIAGFSALSGFVLGSLSPSSVMIGFNVMWVVFGMAVSAISLAQISQKRGGRYQKSF
jgi:O-antigen ligase